ncbi:hypothetical protein D8M17_03005 [Corynebacterium pseudodiphtheriticum]|nr:hypothetical protein D8M17_03005 [Corynebacterium pseudodiphtheriticum]
MPIATAATIAQTALDEFEASELGEKYPRSVKVRRDAWKSVRFFVCGAWFITSPQSGSPACLFGKIFRSACNLAFSFSSMRTRSASESACAGP